MMKNVARNVFICSIFTFCVCLFHLSAGSGDRYTAEDLLRTRSCGSAVISPYGKWVAYTVSIPRNANDKPGSNYNELHMVSVATGKSTPFVTGKTSVSSLKWSPDSQRLAFLSMRGEKAKTQVWVVPVNGGEAMQATHSESAVNSFQWHPKKNKIAYIAQTPVTAHEKKLKEKGYGFTTYEENLKHTNLYIRDLGTPGSKAIQITRDITVRSFVFGSDGKFIALVTTEKNLIDLTYLYKKIHLLDMSTGKMNFLADAPGKMGMYELNASGSTLVYAAALDKNDNQISQVYVLDVKTKKTKNLTIPKFKGHVNWAGWKDEKTVVYRSGEGVWPNLSLVPAAGGKRSIILKGKSVGLNFTDVSFSSDFKHAVLVASSNKHPAELFLWKVGQKTVTRLTHANPWLKKRRLGKQTAVKYSARDGLEIEGLLVYPVDYRKGQKYPMVVLVHGGPEYNAFNGWVSRYSEPTQVLAGKGYAVFVPNYRSSTGYGVEFARYGLNDPAGKEFDDLADGIDFLVKKGIADPQRVGMMGGSYGGYAGAWFASYYTRYVRAVCMYAGVSDLFSKRGTTDIPLEELYVHSGKKLEEMWDISLKRSPIYWAHQSKTAVLITHGEADTRVHPIQSLEFYRRLKINNHIPVRFVTYPGERHGNRKQTGKIDLCYRVLQWFDWYLKDKKKLDGPLPPLDISKHYGLK